MAPSALLDAAVRVEQAWLDALVGAGVAPADAAADLRALVDGLDAAALAEGSESGGNPVMPLVAALRSALRDGGHEAAATWLHRGLTSQDVLDTAVLLCARDAVTAVRRELRGQVERLVVVVEEHRGTVLVARTLTQPAVPTTFGAKAAGWLHGLLDADQALSALRWPVQLGGAAGTLSAVVELAGVDGARSLRRSVPLALGLEPSPPWHTRRTAVTRLGDAATTATDAWGRVANDVLALGRSEVAELRDASAGGSSTMPHKANPTLAVLVRRAALAAPQLAASLHLAAAEQVDERADGGWHVEWHTLALLLRRTAVAARQASDLLRGLQVDAERMAAHLRDQAGAVLAEQEAVAGLTGRPAAATYLGLVDDLVDEALARARTHEHAPTAQEDL
ncbi:lyase family protein [Quadrisphaera oryzae]|uniref:lyase family protein n=1 Tax=Quadrisphaera TaxID=317661 RepID=UPI001646001E|nr:3-carboxy-cis,cis-muconate cycloisomerase [Quadrisphaera sp. RL12-1S]